MLAEAALVQTRLAIPTLQGFFMPEDERREGEDEERGAEEDIVSSDEDSDEEQVAGESDPEVSGEDDDPGDAPAGRATGPSGNGDGGANHLTAVDGDDDDTGYGAGGLSWEAVLGAIQVA